MRLHPAQPFEQHRAGQSLPPVGQTRADLSKNADAVLLGDDVVTRAKALAAKRHTGYQTMLKEFVIERLYEEEKRAGLR